MAPKQVLEVCLGDQSRVGLGPEDGVDQHCEIGHVSMKDAAVLFRVIVVIL